MMKQDNFPLPKGTRQQACPTAYFEPIFGAKFSPFNNITESFEFNYFSNAFDLISAMRGVSKSLEKSERISFTKQKESLGAMSV